jgi:hypothetical protein
MSDITAEDINALIETLEACEEKISGQGDVTFFTAVLRDVQPHR